MSDTVLLTGATGFLGSHLLISLLKKGKKVVILKRSFSDTRRIYHLFDKIRYYDIDIVPIARAFEDQQIDVVIHTATNYGRKNEPITQIVNDNLNFGLQLVETATKYQTPFFINTDTLQNKNTSNYSLSKKQFVEWLEVFGVAKNLKIINVRLEHMYGPGDDEKKFIVWLMERLFSNESHIDLTSGEQKRDFIFIDDVVSAYLILLEQIKNVSRISEFDVGTGEFISIKDFVLMLKDNVELFLNKQLNTKLNFGGIPLRQGDLIEIEEDLNPIFNLGWKPETSLEEGLKLVVQDFFEKRNH